MTELTLFPTSPNCAVVATNEVRQHHHVTFSHQRKVTLLSKRILARVLEQIQRDDLQLRPSYQVHVGSLLDGTEKKKNNNYTYAKSALIELNDVKWSFEDLESNHFYQRNLLDNTQKKPSEVKDGVITLILNPALSDYFLGLAGEYTLYSLDGYLGLQSWYAMRFFEILAHFKDTGWWEVDLAEFRRLFDCAPELDRLGKPVKDKLTGKVKMNYDRTGDLIKKTILVAQRELVDTPYAFTYKELKAKTNPGGSGRPAVVGFLFQLKQKQTREIPDSWFLSEAHARAIERLRAYKVTDRNMALYLKAITLQGVNKLLSDWDAKRVGPQAIDKPENYCNAVIVRVGKLAMEEARREAKELRLEVKKVIQGSFFPGGSNPIE